MQQYGGEIAVPARAAALAGIGVAALALAVVATSGEARADGPVDLPSATRRAFEGVEACVALRDVAPGAGAAVSDASLCGRRMPPCATFELPATVIAIDRGVVPDANTPVKRNPAIVGDPPGGVTLRDAFQRQIRWVYEETARRIGAEAFDRTLAAMRYGNAEASGPVESIGRGERADGLIVSAAEQVEFLARLKRGELPTTSESQARTTEIMPVEKNGEATLALKSGACDGAGWIVGWVDRPQRSSVVFATVTFGPDQNAEELQSRTRKLLGELALTPAK